MTSQRDRATLNLKSNMEARFRIRHLIMSGHLETESGDLTAGDHRQPRALNVCRSDVGDDGIDKSRILKTIVCGQVNKETAAEPRPIRSISGFPGKDDVTIELRPFKHQVGGHTCVLEIGQTTICKPYVERESWFYANAPDALKQFIPKYLGETYVSCEVKDSRKCLMATVPRALIKNDDMSRYENAGTCDFLVAKRRKKQPKSDVLTNDCILQETPKLRSWSSTCVERQISRYGFWANNQPQRFIMLENLVWDCVKPCLMDLKMGKRQFSENESEEKRMLKERRCTETTSASLGFRICGSQSYRIQTSTYTFHDKYYGRSLNELGTKEELRHFFHNGLFLRCDVIEKIIEKIVSLERVLNKEKHFHLHSTSLLLLYDGHVADDVISVASNHVIKKKDVTDVIRKVDDNNISISSLSYGLSTPSVCSNENTNSDVRNKALTLNPIIDVKISSSVSPKRESCFDHCDISDSGTVGKEHRAFSHVESLSVEKCIVDVLRSENNHVENAPVQTPNMSRRNVESIEIPSEINTIVTKTLHSDHVTHASKQRVFTSNAEQQCRVDMRLIDFANASDKTSDMENGENRPILFGLGNLKAILNEILKEEIHNQ
ncbi:uncharacterized protein LOC127854870 isoform X2 [Dreissena polymorpha]|uniref:uncharacterized protein LOC127854870 isoform X2 n=1 Tax=Dreissena polymorpha TaxID=45954 RepID=UPI002264481C|nr:uncharacterized protein LOC127854870 isoform X2 [Dreissena polymorpha]